MAFGLSFQPAVDQTPSERRSTMSALGPGQKALKILAMHFPKVSGAGISARPSQPGKMTPDAAVFQALVNTLQGAPTGGFPTTGPLVDTFANLSEAQTPTTITPTTPDLTQAPNNAPTGDAFSSLVSQLRGIV